MPNFNCITINCSTVYFICIEVSNKLKKKKAEHIVKATTNHQNRHLQNYKYTNNAASNSINDI